MEFIKWNHCRSWTATVELLICSSQNAAESLMLSTCHINTLLTISSLRKLWISWILSCLLSSLQGLSQLTQTLSSFSIPALLTYQTGSLLLFFALGDCSVHGRMFSIIPSLYLLDASDTSHPLPFWQSKMFPDIAKCPLGSNFLLLQT